MSVRIESNGDAVNAHIERVIDSFDFTIAGEEASLGRDLAADAAMGIADRSSGSRAPDGSTWDPNAPPYAAAKAKKYSAYQPNVRTGQMLSQASLLGDTTVEPELVTMRYGTGEPPTSAANGAALAKGDTEITDIEKAFFNNRKRKFYGLDAEIRGVLRDTAAEALAKSLKGA